MESPPIRVIRAAGLPAKSDEDLERIVSIAFKQLQFPGPGLLPEPEIEVLPSCYEQNHRVALVKFTGVMPSDLAGQSKTCQCSGEGVDVNFDREFHGFTQLYKSQGQVTADIIALTGLDGHAYGSWTGRGKLRRMWLRDFLASDLPSCRTMIYGYDSKLSGRNLKRLLDYGRDLLANLEGIRMTDEEKRRPIFFIAHSFGGLILAHAIVKAATRNFHDSANFYDSTFGILFFGVPHKGLVVDDIQTMLSEDEEHPAAGLLDEIKEKSNQLAAQLIDFKNALDKKMVVSFYEQQQTRRLQRDEEGNYKRTGEFMTSVERDSALLELPDNMEGKVPMDSDHSNMVKFDAISEKGYRLALLNLKKFAREASSIVEAPGGPNAGSSDQVKFQEAGNLWTSNFRKNAIPNGDEPGKDKVNQCLQDLKVEDPQAMLAEMKDLKTRSAGTCEWILQREKFREWRSCTEAGLLRLVGSAGIGKSVMSTFLASTLADDKQIPDQTFAFFFCRHNNMERSSPVTILRSLVWQLLKARNKLLEHVEEKLQTSDKNHILQNYYAIWDIFEKMIVDERAGNVFIVIDALDECDTDELAKLIKSIKNLFSPTGTPLKTSIKLLIAYRDKTKKIDENLKSVGTQLRMENEAVRSDLERYIEKAVEELSSQKNYTPDLRKEVTEALHLKAEGTFLWVSLMIKVLRHTDSWEVPEMLQNLPAELSGVYVQILKGITTEDARRKARFLIGILVAARQPLKKIEIAAAFACSRGKFLDREALRDWVGICTYGSALVEFHRDSTVTFCHQTVIDFLLETDQTDNDWYRMTEKEVHHQLFEICWKYLNMPSLDLNAKLTQAKRMVLDEGDLQHYPFLEYSFNNWTEHAAILTTRGPDTNFVLPVDRQSLEKAPKLRDQWLLYSTGKNQGDVMEALLLAKADIEVRDEFSETPLFVAALCGSGLATKLLLDAGADIEARDKFECTPLFVAAREGKTEVIRLLLDAGADKDARDSDQETPLFQAARNGHIEVMRLLLDAGADKDARDIKQHTPLYMAAYNGQTEAIRLLLDAGADKDARDIKQHTPLYMAAYNGQTEAIRLLLDVGADKEARDTFKTTPLSMAARNGQTEAVRLLLDAGADKDTQDLDQETPLFAAARHGHAKVIELLLDAGADTEYGDMDGDTPLIHAAKIGQTTAIDLLLQADADKDAQNERGETPLLGAAVFGHTKAIQMLLDAGANKEARNHDDCTALLGAANNGRLKAIKALLNAGAKIDARDEDDTTPLLEAAKHGSLGAMKALLNAGAEKDARDKDGRTPLLGAVTSDREATAKTKMLIEADADVGAEDRKGRTALSLARDKGRKDIVKLLQDAGAPERRRWMDDRAEAV